MKTEQILMCIVALILGMLLANMLMDVCGCKKLVEGTEKEVKAAAAEKVESIICNEYGTNGSQTNILKECICNTLKDYGTADNVPVCVDAIFELEGWLSAEGALATLPGVDALDPAIITAGVAAVSAQYGWEACDGVINDITNRDDILKLKNISEKCYDKAAEYFKNNMPQAARKIAEVNKVIIDKTVAPVAPIVAPIAVPIVRRADTDAPALAATGKVAQKVLNVAGNSVKDAVIKPVKAMEGGADLAENLFNEVF